MSGPKGIGYTIQESAEQRARRELASAQSALRSALAVLADERARLSVLGIDLAPVSTILPTSTASCRAAQQETEADVARAREQISTELAERAQASMLAGLAAVSDAANAGGDLGLKRRSKAVAQSDEAPTPSVPDPSVTHDVRRILSRLEREDESIARLAQEVITAPPATAQLLIHRLSGDVDRVNSAVHEERRATEDREAELARAQLRAALRKSDQQHVLEQVVESLEELGYAVHGTSVTQPGQLVLDSASFPGYGVAAGVSEDEDEIILRPVRVDASAGGSDLQVEDELCAQIPQLAGRLASRGVGTDRVRSIPAGTVPVPVETVIGSRSLGDSQRRKAGTSTKRASRAREL